MTEYPKIQSIFKRDKETHKFRVGEYSCPEFLYLESNMWRCTEKIDGTNIRVLWDEVAVHFRGKTDRADIPSTLLEKLQELFPPEKFRGLPPMCLYGEGYGAKIQKGGGKYIHDGVNFALFDILIDKWWLKIDDVFDIAFKLGQEVTCVPIVAVCSLPTAIEDVQTFSSMFGDFPAEGMVLKPVVELKDRAGRRVITKMKRKDF